MKAVNHVSSISYSNPVRSVGEDDARVVLLVTADSALSHRLMRALSSRNQGRADDAPLYQVPVAASVAQAQSCVGRMAPDVILLDENIAAPTLYTHVVQNLASLAPVIFLAAPENLGRWCAQYESSLLVAQGRVECVARQGDFMPLVARLIERHANAQTQHERPLGRASVLPPAAHRVHMDSEDVPLDFGEVLRHEVNNPLTGILGNSELLLSRRDRLPADMVERLEIIADLAIRLRETVRRLSNSLERRPEASGHPTAHASAELASSHRHRPLT
jgi:signal transduction histidine kinase